MSDNKANPTSELIMKTCGLPLNNCKTIVDFFQGMYDVLEAHRWVIAEHKVLHRDISHRNIIVEAQDARNIQEFNDAKRPAFINEVLHGKPAPAMARLIDMDFANLDRSKAKPEEGKPSDEPVRYPTGTPRFIARSVAAGEILDDTYYLPMPTLQPDIAAKYKGAYHDDSSELRTFSDANGSTHGGHPSHEGLIRFHADPYFSLELFEHQPFHDAESVFWCIVAFVLLAKPLKKDVDENRDAFNKIWTCLAEHEEGNGHERRDPLIERGKWKRWLHKDLSFISGLMVALSFQVRPEWALLTPAPDPLHLHEAMQRLILQHVHIWETKGVNVELDTLASRNSTTAGQTPMAPVFQRPLIGQVITSGTLGLRKTDDDEPLDADLAELQHAWVDSRDAPVGPEPLEYTSEDENEDTSE